MSSIFVPSVAKHLATQILVIAKLNLKKRFCFERLYFLYDISKQRITCSKLTTEA